MTNLEALGIKKKVTNLEALGIKERATEETLQSIDSTLKRIELILQAQSKIQSYVLDGLVLSEQKLSENSTDIGIWRRKSK